FLQLCHKAKSGLPPQYLIHSAPFLDIDLYVDRRVVIPRPETEELVLRAAARCTAARLVMDYGTGSGCIAISLARRFPAARVIAVDCSAPALQVARRNAQKYRLCHRISFVKAKLLIAPVLSRLRGRLDLLVANPPYVPTTRLNRLQTKTCLFEPRVGLDGGHNGATIVSMLLRYGPEFLRPGGLLALEIDHLHGPLVRQLLPMAEIENDLAGHIRYVFFRRPMTS
ncbi:MAG: peptide chain release factor N(5)-glutamine methyltransferase, partial [candidate division WOR-3 bacterium]